MFIHEKLETNHFSPSEQVIVTFLLEKQLQIENLSTSEIAKETYSSKSTIVKMAQRLGFKGWSDFKKVYITELHYLQSHQSTIDANYPFNERDNIIAVANKIATLKQESIAETASLLHYDSLQKATHLLTKSRSIHIFAVSNNLLIAQEFRYNMERIKKNVHVHAIQGEGMYAATLMDPTDCALIISYSGETATLLTIVSLLKEQGIPMVLISSLADSSMSSIADCTLRMATKERLYSKIATYANDASITYLLDVLYSCIFQTDYHKNAELRKRTSRLFETGRKSNAGVLREK